MKFLLIKENPDGQRAVLLLEDEKAVREHLEAMWRFTEWRLVAIVKR